MLAAELMKIKTARSGARTLIVLGLLLTQGKGEMRVRSTFIKLDMQERGA
jgi:hypothetical protein